MTVATESPATEHLDLARQQYALTHEQLRSVADANRALIDAKASTTYEAYGQINFATALIWGVTEARLTFSDGDVKLRFYGEQWGLGFGAGTSFGAAVFAVPPQQLIGTECAFQASSVAVGAGGVTVTWLQNGRFLGTFVGGSLGIGASNTGGHGKWTQRS